MAPHDAVDRATILIVAGEAQADPRSVVVVLRGGRVRGMVDARIRRVLVERGLVAPQPAVPLASGPMAMGGGWYRGPR